MKLLCCNILFQIAEIVKYSEQEQGLNSRLLIKLAEHFAHSKNWKRRQTFALLCCEILSTEALKPESFASEMMPHLLDLSWDRVANIRLVVAKALAQYIIVHGK